MKFTVDELRPVSLFEGLSDTQLEWFCEHGTSIELEPGERILERGQSADHMFVVVTGIIDGYEEIGGQWLRVTTSVSGDATGLLPFSRMTHYPRYAVAVEPSRVLRVDKCDFKEMIYVSHEVGQRLVAQMSDRVRGDVRLKQHQEKMMALGKLSAGLAHELNNPASAVGRAAATLSEHVSQLSAAVTGLLRLQLPEKAVDAIRELPTIVREREASNLSPLERSEREEELAAWLEDHGVADSWDIVGSLADAGLTVQDMEDLGSRVPNVALRDALVWVESELSTARTIALITSSSERISSLIASVKTYSHMDRSSEHKLTDVRAGLDNTLTIFGHKIAKKNIRVTRSYAEDLPEVSGNAGELNQVWTNLIDNAIDAMAERGQLVIEAKVRDSAVAVSVIDDGPGIPDDVRPRMFEPFYTTKAVGEGTGLGLDIALRIVQTHRGNIDVESKPGRTELRVLLPIGGGGS